MKYLATLLLIFGFGLSGFGQTIKSLGYNTTNGQVVANTGTNVLTFTNNVRITDQVDSTSFTFWGMQGWGAAVSLEERLLRDGETAAFQWGALENTSLVPLNFGGSSSAAATRTNLGLGWSALTNTNASNFRDAIGLGSTNTVTFSNVVNNGNFTNNNGTIYGLKTNVGPFEGIGNFFASNNTTVDNETLFRVGVAEATNKSAQFGFRVARTNNGGEGLAVFSVFGYNALMMIGPSDRSRSNSLTNTNAAIEADLWTMSESNRVMTLRDTNTGATMFHREIGWSTNANATNTAPANTTNATVWVEVWIGTNSYRLPLYQ